MNTEHKNNLTKIQTAARRMLELAETAIQTEQELAGHTGSEEINFDALVVTSDNYPCAPDQILVSCDFGVGGTAKDLKPVSAENFKKLVEEVSQKTIKEKSSWRTLPGVNYFTGAREKLSATIRETHDFTNASEFRGLFVIGKSYLSDHYVIKREYCRLTLIPKDKHNLIEKIVRCNDDIFKIDHDKLYPALESLCKQLKAYIPAPTLKYQYTPIEKLGGTYFSGISTVTAFHRLDYDNLKNEISCLENSLKTKIATPPNLDLSTRKNISAAPSHARSY